MEELQQTLSRIEQYVIIRTKDVLTLRETAVMLGMQPESVRKMMVQHRIPYYKPSRGTIYFKKSEVEGWMLQNRVSTEAELEIKAALMSNH